MIILTKLEFITDAELCELLKVTRQATYNWRVQGMPYRKMGKLVRYNYKEVIEWLENR